MSAGQRAIAICFTVAVAAWGFGLYGHSLYLAELTRLHGWSNTLVSTVVTGHYLASALLITAVPGLWARFGARAMLGTGLLALGGAVVLLGQIRSPAGLIAAYALFALAWSLTSSSAIVTTLAGYFDRGRGMAVSIALTGASGGGIVIAPGLDALIRSLGFPGALLIGGAVAVALVVVVTLLPAAPPAPVTAPATSRRELLGRRDFWLLAAPYVLGIVSQVAFLTHQVPIVSATLGRDHAAASVALVAGCSVIGRLGLGSYAERGNPRLMMIAALAAQAAAFAIIALDPGVAMTWFACALVGLSVGNMIVLPALLAQREFGTADFGAVFALANAIGQFCYALAPGATGALRDATGSYAVPLLACVALQAVGCVVTAAGLRRPAARG